MTTTKTERLEAEIAKAKARIIEHQTKLKELEGKRAAVENAEIVDIVRGMSIPLDQLAPLLQAAKRGGALPALTPGTSGQVGQIQPSEDGDEQ